MRILTILTVLGSTAAWLDCRTAKSRIKSYEKKCLLYGNGNNSLVAAGRSLVEGKKKEKCLKVTKVFDYALKIQEPCGSNGSPLSRLTVLLSDAPGDVKRLGSIVVVPRMFDLLRKSRINVNFDNIEAQLRAIDFFSSNPGIAENLLARLDNFEKEREKWGRIRSYARGKISLSTIFLSRYRRAFLRSFPAGYFLAAICEVTSAEPKDYGKFGGVFGQATGDNLKVGEAISGLSKWTQVPVEVWLGRLISGDSPELLRALLAADVSMQAGGSISMIAGNDGLPGLVFVRWIETKYSTSFINGKSRTELASQAASEAIKLEYDSRGDFHGGNMVLRRARGAVVGFLDITGKTALGDCLQFIRDARNVSHNSSLGKLSTRFFLGSLAVSSIAGFLQLALLTLR